MIKKILIVISLVCMLYSCGSANLGSRMKKIELGMTKPEVISILGNSYNVLRAVQTPEGGLETTRFLGNNITSYHYIVIFLDGKLVEWYEEVPETQHPASRPHSHN